MPCTTRSDCPSPTHVPAGTSSSTLSPLRAACPASASRSYQVSTPSRCAGSSHRWPATTVRPPLSTGSEPSPSAPSPSGYQESIALRVSRVIRSMIVTTRSDCAMWWMNPISEPTEASASTSDVVTARPGTNSWAPARTSRSVSRANVNVPTKTPSAPWVQRSRSSDRSTRGENWLEASCSATIVIEKVSAAKVSTDDATTLRIARAESGPPP